MNLCNALKPFHSFLNTFIYVQSYVRIMKCEMCHRVTDDTMSYITMYGMMRLCSECKEKWDKRRAMNGAQVQDQM